MPLNQDEYKYFNIDMWNVAYYLIYSLFYFGNCYWLFNLLWCLLLRIGKYYLLLWWNHKEDSIFCNFGIKLVIQKSWKIFTFSILLLFTNMAIFLTFLGFVISIVLIISIIGICNWKVCPGSEDAMESQQIMPGNGPSSLVQIQS